MIGKLLMIAGLPLLAVDVTRVTNTQTIPFPNEGTLRFERSSGEIHIQAWDRPEIEITFSKSTYAPKLRNRLDAVQMKTEKRGNDVVISTTAPRCKDIQVEYQIHAPRNITLAIDHNTGGVYVTGIAGDIQAKVRNGQITLRLPETGVYAITAKSTTGRVYSDFDGAEKSTWLFGEGFAKPADSARKLDLRIGFGDILILKTPYRSTELRQQSQ
jgi:hypothetical protein